MIAHYVWLQEIVLDLFDEGQLVVVMYFMPHSPECAVCSLGTAQHVLSS